VVKKQKHQFLDEHLFRQEMGDVVPLKTAATTDSKAPRMSNRVRRAGATSSAFTQPMPPLADDETHINADDGSTHRKNGVQKKILQKLKRGRFPVKDQLDLHSMTMETGHQALLDFITEAQCSTLECIRVIHGKGLRSESLPRLKIMTRQVLREHPQVLAFTACKPADGGTGAVDILLKSK